MNFDLWDRNLREILHSDHSPLSLRSGRYWEVNNKIEALSLVKGRVFDKHLNLIKDICIEVLREIDPKFDFAPDKRYMASIYDKKPTYSDKLREGLSETIVWLGINSGSLRNCSPGKRNFIAASILREIFSDASWQLWGSLNQLLATLAEADPDEFLNAVESALRKTPSPFDELFKQEGDGITGTNYLSGLYWALEGLAWNEEHLVRVSVILAELAEHDPGGRWANRPANSIVDMLLPWHPQTLAPVEKRIAAIRAIRKEFPNIAWKILLGLLPNSHQTTSGTHKPKWRNPLPDDWQVNVTNGEYWEQVNQYAVIAVEMACEDLTRTKELVDNMDNLPPQSFEAFLEHLATDEIVALGESDRTPIWEKLVEFVNKHRRYSDAKWALPGDIVNKIEFVADKLKPTSPMYFHERLFSNDDSELYEELGNWEEQQKKLAEHRQDAIKEIFQSGGVDAVIQFAGSVDSPHKVGTALGCIFDSTVEKRLLPGYLNSESHNLSLFASAYVWSAQLNKGWAWVDKLDKSSWSDRQIGCFLSSLPFCKETWDRVHLWLGQSESHYWSRTNINPYQADEQMFVAVDKLIEYGRPRRAIDCLAAMRYKKQPIEITQCLRALRAAISSQEPSHAMDNHHIVEIIKFLQVNPDVSEDDVFQIEWAYLTLLDHHGDTSPKVSESRLVNSPEFFCQLIQLIYRSKNKEAPNIEPNEASKAIASNAWRLLNKWKTPPGMQADGSFDDNHFSTWLKRVKEICVESGHIEVALINVGEVLIHAPPDKDGLWVNKSVAEALNDRDAEDMRSGYSTGIHNSRGVHWVDPTGKPEHELAAQFRQKAEDVENAGFQRLAVTLRGLAEDYDREAERIISEHSSE